MPINKEGGLLSMHPNICRSVLEHIKISLGYEGQISFLSKTYHSYSDKGIHLIRPKTLEEVVKGILEAKQKKLSFIFIYF